MALAKHLKKVLVTECGYDEDDSILLAAKEG
jgi:hypothetical protein